MATGLPSPPASRSTTPNTQTDAQQQPDALTFRLDELLEQYLELLDQYTLLRAELAKNFSDGFFSLANAQRTASMGAGRRYGQDGYDGRMKALRRVRIIGVDADTSRDENNDEKGTSSIQQIQTYEVSTKHRTIAATEEKSTSTEITDHEAEAVFGKKGSRGESSQKTKNDPAYRDPASWYGIFVSPHLRRTQTLFVHSVEKVFPLLISTRSKMQAIERDIWEARNKLGLESQYSDLVENNSVASADTLLDEINQTLARSKISRNG